jgi:hypothetical protein
MDSIEPPADRKGPIRPLGYNLALLAHLIYLARHGESVRHCGAAKKTSC